jgi:hypothetical protein
LAQLSFICHMAAVRHERCAEHGDLVEVSAADARIVPRDHDHCPLASGTTAGSSPVVVAAGLDVAPAIPSAAVASPCAPLTQLDILDIAPKHGPPTA